MRRATAATLLSLLATLALPRAAFAQGEDAVPVRPGTLRVVLAPDWARWNRRFGAGTPGFTKDALEPLGVDFASESLGVDRLSLLLPVQSRIQALTGQSGFALNLGRARITLNANVRVVPLGFELGVTRRLSLSLFVPLVRSRVEAFLLGPVPDTGAAGAATRGNVGFNPAFLTPGALDAFREQVDAALIALQTQATSGPPALRGQAQATLSSVQPLLCGLYTLAGGSAGGSNSLCFAATPDAMSPVLPLAGTAAGDTLAAMLARDQASYETLRTLYAGAGVALPALNETFALPDSALDSLGLRRLFSDPAGPLAADSLTNVVRTRLGDVEVGATYQLADRRRFRSQLAVTVRLPTGTRDSENNLIDVGTGDRQLDVEVATRNDLIVASTFWVHAGARYGRQFADELMRRVTPANFPFAPFSSLALVRRDLGDYVAIDIVPNWRLDDAFSVGVGYHYFSQGATRFSYVDPLGETRIGLPATVLEQETAVRRMRMGAGITFSTLGRYAEHRASLPYTVTASYQNTFWGKGGAVPQASVFRLVIRGYVRVW